MVRVREVSRRYTGGSTIRHLTIMKCYVINFMVISLKASDTEIQTV
jgi:hypothetical protein